MAQGINRLFRHPHLLFNRLLFSAAGGIFFLFQHPLLHRAQLSGRPKPSPCQYDDSFANGLSSFFGNLAVIFLFIVPLFTMRLLAEEKRSGTMELLFTFPLTDWGVIMGKFLAALLLYALLLAITVLYSLAFATVLKLDWGAIAVGYLGLLLLGGAFLALGLFCSSLTENQIIAAIIAFSLMLLFWIIGWYEELGPPAYQGFFKYISTMGHFDAFSRGVLDTRDILYYLGFIFFFLFLTKRQLESRQWRG